MEVLGLLVFWFVIAVVAAIVAKTRGGPGWAG